MISACKALWEFTGLEETRGKTNAQFCSQTIPQGSQKKERKIVETNLGLFFTCKNELSETQMHLTGKKETHAIFPSINADSRRDCSCMLAHE